MSKNDATRDVRIYSAGECPVCIEPLALLQRFGDDALFFYCPLCGCAWTELPAELHEDIWSLSDVAPQGAVVARLGVIHSRAWPGVRDVTEKWRSFLAEEVGFGDIEEARGVRTASWTRVRGIVAGLDAFEPICAAIEAEWRPGPVPSTVAFGELGSRLVELSDTLGAEAVRLVLERAEAMLRDGSEIEKTAVTTGFIEALANTIDRDPHDHSWILRVLGPESRAYLRAWDESYGVQRFDEQS